MTAINAYAIRRCQGHKCGSCNQTQIKNRHPLRLKIYKQIYGSWHKNDAWFWKQTRWGGGLLTEKWATGMCSPEDPLFMPSWPFARPPFQHFSFLKILLSSPNLKFLEIFKLQSLEISKEFSFKASNWAKIQFTHILFKISVHKQAATYTKMKVECPLPPHADSIFNNIFTHYNNIIGIGRTSDCIFFPLFFFFCIFCHICIFIEFPKIMLSIPSFAKFIKSFIRKCICNNPKSLIYLHWFH